MAWNVGPKMTLDLSGMVGKSWDVVYEDGTRSSLEFLVYMDRSYVSSR